MTLLGQHLYYHFNFFEIASAHCASQRCPLDKLLMLAAKTQTSLAFARLHVTFAFSDELPLQ